MPEGQTPQLPMSSDLAGYEMDFYFILEPVQRGSSRAPLLLGLWLHLECFLVSGSPCAGSHRAWVW